MVLSNKVFKYSVGFIFGCLISVPTFVMASPNYLCPRPDLVLKKTREAIKHRIDEVIIPTNYGILVAHLFQSAAMDVQSDTVTLPTFRYASILFRHLRSPSYDVACSYQKPDLTFYLHSNRLFIGATDYYWYASGHGQTGPYAWCMGGSAEEKNCSFIDKPI